jgi:hypothetical protein
MTAEDANASFLKRKISGPIWLEDIRNPGKFLVLFNQDGSLQSDPVGDPLVAAGNFTFGSQA